jgi:predicted  nucleic acid-binding Zn-ribbon protein
MNTARSIRTTQVPHSETRERRIGELEGEIKQRDKRIMELREERDAERALVAEMREQVRDANETIDQWIEAFGMVQNDKGDYCYVERKTSRDALPRRINVTRKRGIDLLKKSKQGTK